MEVRVDRQMARELRSYQPSMFAGELSTLFIDWHLTAAGHQVLFRDRRAQTDR